MAWAVINATVYVLTPSQWGVTTRPTCHIWLLAFNPLSRFRNSGAAQFWHSWGAPVNVTDGQVCTVRMGPPGSKRSPWRWEATTFYVGLGKTLKSRLQFVQKAAAGLLTRTWKHDHVLPVLTSSHWLPVKYSVSVKILLLTSKCFYGLTQSYNFTILFLKSTDRQLLVTQTSWLACTGDQAFFSDPQNSLESSSSSH